MEDGKRKRGRVLGKIIPNSLVKDTLQVPLSQSRTLEVFDGANLFGADQSLVIRYWLHTLRSQALQRGWVLSQIQLGTDQDDGHVRSMVVDFGVPLCEV